LPQRTLFLKDKNEKSAQGRLIAFTY